MPYTIVVFGYLLGSVPFGLLYGRMAGVDVRQRGSRNIGATNVNRLLGKKLGVLTLVSDLLKGLLPMLFASLLLSGEADSSRWIIMTGGAALLGHCFPIYLGFKGGKGVATALGMYLYLAPLQTLGAIGVFILVVWLSGYVSLGSLLASISMPVMIWLSGGDREMVLATLLVSLLIWIKHHENINRLVKGKEKSWKKKSGDAEK